ncbi:MAG: hypothetical protein ABIJ36_03420 [Patescibacteria group bacterium]|nr:hypothetical protein [Patescibacteria group bacterium]
MNEDTEKQAKKQAFIVGPLVAIGFIGWRVIKGQSLGIEDIMVGLLLGVIVALVSYITISKKKK